jgi:hypothetical protein
MIFAGGLLGLLTLSQNAGNLSSFETISATKIGLNAVSTANSYIERATRPNLGFDDYTVGNAVQPRAILGTDSLSKLALLSTTLGREAGETAQSLYDDVDDYNGLDTMIVVEGLCNFHVVCSVRYYNPVTNTTTSLRTWFKQVTVTVTDTIPGTMRHQFQFNGTPAVITRSAVIGYYHFI